MFFICAIARRPHAFYLMRPVNSPCAFLFDAIGQQALRCLKRVSQRFPLSSLRAVADGAAIQKKQRGLWIYKDWTAARFTIARSDEGEANMRDGLSRGLQPLAVTRGCC